MGSEQVLLIVDGMLEDCCMKNNSDKLYFESQSHE